MEDRFPPKGQEVDECGIMELKQYWNKCLDSERCDSMELNSLIRRQIQESNSPRDAEEGLPLPRQQLLNRSTFSHDRHLTQTKTLRSVSGEEYEHRIQILENQKAELLKVNKQWDQHLRFMKQIYENKQFKEFNLELQKIKEENGLLKKQNHVLRKRSDNYESEIKRLNKVLLQGNAKEKFDSITTRLNPSSHATSYEDIKTQKDVLVHQVKIFEEDFNKEQADKEKIRKEKEELQQVIQKLRLQLLANNKPDYQWYVPGQLPPDVQQKDTENEAVPGSSNAPFLCCDNNRC